MLKKAQVIALEMCEMQAKLQGRKGYHKKGKIYKRLKSAQHSGIHIIMEMESLSELKLTKSYFLFLSFVLRGEV